MTATAEIVTDSAGTCRKMFASDATISRTRPTNRNLPRKAKSRLRHGRVRREREEDRRGEPARQRDQLPAVAEAGGDRQDRRQHQPRDEREAEQRGHAPRAVAQPRDDEQRADHRAEHQQRRHDRRRLEQRDEIELHAGERRRRRSAASTARAASRCCAARGCCRPPFPPSAAAATTSCRRSLQARTCDPWFLPSQELAVRSGPVERIRLTDRRRGSTCPTRRGWRESGC